MNCKHVMGALALILTLCVLVSSYVVINSDDEQSDISLAATPPVIGPVIEVTYHTNGGIFSDLYDGLNHLSLVSEGLYRGNIDEGNANIYGWQLPVPTRDGHIFAGWYFDEDLNNAAPAEIKLSEDLKSDYYAKWIKTPTDGTVLSDDGNRLITAPSDAVDYTIPDGVTTIDKDAFFKCNSLKSITFPSSVTALDTRIFDELRQVSLYIPLDATYMDQVPPFFDIYRTPPANDPLSYVIYQSETVAKVSYCDKNAESAAIADVVIENGKKYVVTGIEDRALKDCTKLKSITIPNTVTSIGQYAFNGCTVLESVIIPSGVTSINEQTFGSCSSLKSVTIPDTVTSIGWYAFSRCSALESVAIPTGVTLIENGAFNFCSSLNSIVIPAGVTDLKDDTFNSCTSLTSIIIPENITAIKERVFNGCTALESIVIPEGVTSIGTSSFENCTALTSITISNTVTSIGESSFKNCTALTSIIIPDSVTSMGSNVFSECSALESATLSKNITSIEQYAFYNCKKLTSIVIPDGVTSIKYAAFYGCSDLASAVIPNTVTSILGSAFNFCKSLTSIVIPEGVTSIERATFNNCLALASVSLPNSLTAIKTNAFNTCSSLTSVVIPEGVTSIGDWAFGQCRLLESIVIPEGVTSIEDNAFYFCDSLKSVTIPSTLTFLGNRAFQSCDLLESAIIIPEGVTTIGDYTFAGCGVLTSITIPSTVTSIGEFAFYYCESLESITIPEGVTDIKLNTFLNCYSLKSVTIPSTVTSIGEKAFNYCYSLADIRFEHADNLPVLAQNSVDTHTETNVYLNKSIYDKESENSFASFNDTYTSYTTLNFKPSVVEVTFNSNGGSAVPSQTVNNGEKAVKPADPTKDEYVFGGWYSNAELTAEYTFTTPVTENITLYAKWYDELSFTTVPSIQNVKVTVDGRTITATVVAENYQYLLWDMGDGSEPVKTYTNSITYTYEKNGNYQVKVKAVNNVGESKEINQSIKIGESNDSINSSDNTAYVLYALLGLALVIGGILTIKRFYVSRFVITLGIILIILAVLSYLGIF